jgi:cell division septation protein DedD
VPWRTRGDYFSFKQEAITQHAPAVSGVYGLFNFHHQILIDSADNIRVALLDHLTDTHFRIGRLRPTGFTFEPCARETRDRRVQELIGEYGSLVQPREGIGLTALWRSLKNPGARAFHPELCATRKPANIEATKVRERTSTFKSAAYARFDRKRFDIAVATCVMIFLSLGSVAMIPQLKNIFRNYVLDRSWTIADAPKPAANGGPHAGPMPGFKIAVAAGRPGSDIIARTLISAAETQEPESISGSIDAEEQGIAAALTSSTPAPVEETAQSPKGPAAEARLQARDIPETYWTVQVLATTNRQIATDSMQRFQLQGYEAFVTQAFVRGQIWHRVRVGNLTTPRAAEALRIELASTEGLRAPFVVRNERYEHRLTLNRR